MSERLLTPRAARAFEALVETVVAPGGVLPPVSRTDAVAAFGQILAASPAINRTGLRALLGVVEVGPLATADRRRFSRLAPERRLAWLQRLEHGAAGPAFEGLVALAKLAYYGDDGVMGALGYDADANLARGRALRAAEARW
jgi:hypothetical protein